MRSFASSDGVGHYLRGIVRIAAVIIVISVGGAISDYVTTTL